MRVCKKVDSSFETMDSKETSAIAERYPLFSKEATLCHAVQAPLAMTEWGWITKEAALRLLCHADKSARNDRKEALYKQDSRSCGGALQALKNLGKVSDLVGRAFHKFFNLVKLPTQYRI